MKNLTNEKLFTKKFLAKRPKDKRAKEKCATLFYLPSLPVLFAKKYYLRV
jgi:hypothetical protein